MHTNKNVLKNHRYQGELGTVEGPTLHGLMVRNVPASFPPNEGSHQLVPESFLHDAGECTFVGKLHRRVCEGFSSLKSNSVCLKGAWSVCSG